MGANWIGIASAEHVRRGRTGGFMQLGHGKGAPLRRMNPGDRIIYYSPTTIYGERDGPQSFTAIGTIAEGEPYRFDTGGGFHPFRQDVASANAQETSIRPLLDRLVCTAGNKNWGGCSASGCFPSAPMICAYRGGDAGQTLFPGDADVDINAQMTATKPMNLNAATTM